MMQHLVKAKTHAKKATVSQWCRVLGVSRSGLYAARQRLRLPKPFCALDIQAKAAFEASGQSYRSRRLSAALQLKGLDVGRHRVRTLMRSNGLRARWRRKFVIPRTATTHYPWRPMCWRASSIPRPKIALGLRHHLRAHAQRSVARTAARSHAEATARPASALLLALSTSASTLLVVP